MKLRYKISGLPADLPTDGEHQVKVTDVVADDDTITVVGEYVPPVLNMLPVGVRRDCKFGCDPRGVGCSYCNSVDFKP